MKRFFSDVRKYWGFVRYTGESELKASIAGSYLGWLWWVLDPLLFMCVYFAVFGLIFGKTEQYFAAFIFIGHSAFNFFSKAVKSSVKVVASNKAMVTKVYMPKYVLLMTKLFVLGFEYFIAFALAVGTMVLYRVPISWHILLYFPLVMLMFVLCFGIGLFLMHFGVYVEDLANIINVAMKLIFYLSGVFFSIPKRVENPLYQTILLKCNPIAFIMNEMRNCLLYQANIDWTTYCIWLGISLLLCCLGVPMIYRNENSYVKMM